MATGGLFGDVLKNVSGAIHHVEEMDTIGGLAGLNEIERPLKKTIQAENDDMIIQTNSYLEREASSINSNVKKALFYDSYIMVWTTKLQWR